MCHLKIVTDVLGQLVCPIFEGQAVDALAL